MKKVVFLLLAMLTMSCSNDIIEEEIEETVALNCTQDEYDTMYEFMEVLYYSELFGISKPDNLTYDDMMLISAPIIMSDTFADTIGEGECEKVYRLMLAYFKDKYPEASVTSYLQHILDCGLYWQATSQPKNKKPPPKGYSETSISSTPII